MIETEPRAHLLEPGSEKSDLKRYLQTLDALSQRAAGLEQKYKSVAEKIRARASYIKKEKLEPANEIFDRLVKSEDANREKQLLEFIQSKKLFAEPKTKHAEIAAHRQEYADWVMDELKGSEIMTYLPNSVITEVGMIKEAINSPEVFGGVKLTEEDLESDCKRYESQLDGYEKLMSQLSNGEF